MGSVSKRVSRLVRMPTSRPSSTIGTPEMWYFCITISASASRSVGRRVTGSTIIPASDRLTLSTSAACKSTGRLRCITPRPPSRAMAIAMRASVTVSMGEETTGRLMRMRRVRNVAVLTSCGSTSLRPGLNKTSSNVRPSVDTQIGVSRSRGANPDGVPWSCGWPSVHGDASSDGPPERTGDDGDAPCDTVAMRSSPSAYLAIAHLTTGFRETGPTPCPVTRT